MKRIFITGGTGFFGKSMLDYRLRHPEVAEDEWTILSRDPGKFMKRYPRLGKWPGVRLRQGDIRTFAFCEAKLPNENWKNCRTETGKIAEPD